jgi:hypothetical protein
MRRIVLAAVFAAVVAAAVPAFAHHSFAAEYFEDQKVTVEGELVEFEYRSPHSWVHVMTRDDNGQMQKYSAEWVTASRLKQNGVNADTLKIGDRLVISGAPGRNASERRVHLKSIERPVDGWKWAGRAGPR